MTAQGRVTAYLLDLTADIVSAHVANNPLAAGDLPALIASVHSALTGLGTRHETVSAGQEPAIPVRRSVKPDHIVCLEDGKRLKILKRRLMTHYRMTPDQYRTKWNLKADYPMVAPDHAEQRSALVKKMGLGRKKTKPSAHPEPAAPKTVRARRKKISAVSAD
ncbi:MAG TPA: MucR family transcriptional regulator [Rhizorhapis sp.]|nr:MucR family transcriptional regulator [Rhizorhapis sp.]HKR17551.1 MucR family transcriptional regulator [Rhizorhapis sp.]